MAKPKPETDADKARQAQRIIDRVERETETLGTSSFARISHKATSHMLGTETQPEDAAELWGKRVGRGLAVIAMIVLGIWLYNYLTR